MVGPERIESAVADARRDAMFSLPDIGRNNEWTKVGLKEYSPRLPTGDASTEGRVVGMGLAVADVASTL